MKSIYDQIPYTHPAIAEISAAFGDFSTVVTLLAWGHEITSGSTLDAVLSIAHTNSGNNTSIDSI